MAEKSTLSDELLRQLISVGEVDVLVGVSTYNNAKTVGHVIRAIQVGLLKYFPRDRAVVINADGGSRDATPEIVRAASINDLQRGADLHTLRTLPFISTVYSGSPSSGLALHTILAAAELLRAKACVIISPNALSIEPEWLERLLRPVYRDNVDFVAPVYRRHKFDGLLLRNLVYPITRALYAKRVREPYAVDFAFSGRLCGHFLEQQTWGHESDRSAVEISLIISAITGGFRLSQSFLGTKSPVDRSSADLVTAIRKIVGTLFWSLESTYQHWSARSDSEAIPTLGPTHDVTLEPVRVNRKRLCQMFNSGVAELEPVLKSILSAGTMLELQRITKLAEDDVRYPDELWARTVYEFAAAYHKTVISRDHIIQALVPLYRGKMYTFLTENRDASEEQVELHVEELCQTFEKLKPYLLELWGGMK